MQNSPIQWLIDHKKYILYFIVILLVLIAITFRFVAGNISKTEASYLVAENDFSLLESSRMGELSQDRKENILESLIETTQKYPDLHSKYDGFIAQRLLTQGNVNESLGFAKRTLARTAKDNLSSYSHFARTTLLIAEEQYQQALEQSLALKESMLQSEPQKKHFEAILFAYNLFRIAMLQQHLGDIEEELKTWGEWRHYAQGGENISYPGGMQAFSLLNQQIGEGNFTLLDYIAVREKHRAYTHFKS